MGTIFNKLRGVGSLGDAHETPANYLEHKDEPLDKYATYLALGERRSGDQNDPDNLFADSTLENKRWLELTRRFLRYTKHR